MAHDDVNRKTDPAEQPIGNIHDHWAAILRAEWALSHGAPRQALAVASDVLMKIEHATHPKIIAWLEPTVKRQVAQAVVACGIDVSERRRGWFDPIRKLSFAKVENWAIRIATLILLLLALRRLVGGPW